MLAAPSYFRRLRRWLAGSPSAPADLGALEQRFLRAQVLVRAFYAFVLYIAVMELPSAAGLAQPRRWAFLWPVAWLDFFPASAQGAAILVLLGVFVATSLAGTLFPGARAARIAALVGLLEWVALRNSEGKIGHSLHLPVLAALVLAFLPRGWARDDAPRWARLGTLQTFAAAQAIILLTYTMSGFGKIGGGLWELFSGRAHPFHLDGFARVIAARLLQTHSESGLGAWLILHPWASGPMLPGAIYVQAASLWVAFRPALHRPWGASLMLFHLANSLILTIHFPHSVFLLALFFLASPFAPARLDWRVALAALPLWGSLWRRIAARRPAPAVEIAPTA